MAIGKTGEMLFQAHAHDSHTYKVALYIVRCGGISSAHDAYAQHEPFCRFKIHNENFMECNVIAMIWKSNACVCHAILYFPTP